MAKYCFDCKQPKEESEYYPNPKTKDGLRHICKVCDKVRVMNNKKARAEAKLAEESNADELIKQVEDGTFQVDQKWLLKELITQYKGDKVRDKLKALDMIAKVSGYNEETGDEKAIIASLMESMKDGKREERNESDG